MPNQLASIPPLPGGYSGATSPPSIQGAIVDLKTNPRGEQLIAQATQIRARTLTSAELLALKGADIQLVEAPGPNYAIHFEGCSLRFNFLATAYTINAGTLKVYLGPSASAIALTADLAALINAGATSDNIGVPGLAAGVQTQANSENVGLFLGNAGVAQFSLGDGTLDITVIYSVVQM